MTKLERTADTEVGHEPTGWYTLALVNAHSTEHRDTSSEIGCPSLLGHVAKENALYGRRRGTETVVVREVVLRALSNGNTIPSTNKTKDHIVHAITVDGVFG